MSARLSWCWASESGRFWLLSGAQRKSVLVSKASRLLGQMDYSSPHLGRWKFANSIFRCLNQVKLERGPALHRVTWGRFSKVLNRLSERTIFWRKFWKEHLSRLHLPKLSTNCQLVTGHSNFKERGNKSVFTAAQTFSSNVIGPIRSDDTKLVSDAPKRGSFRNSPSYDRRIRNGPIIWRPKWVKWRLLIVCIKWGSPLMASIIRRLDSNRLAITMVSKNSFSKATSNWVVMLLSANPRQTALSEA